LAASLAEYAVLFDLLPDMNAVLLVRSIQRGVPGCTINILHDHHAEYRPANRFTCFDGVNAVPDIPNADGKPLLFTGPDDNRDPLKSNYFSLGPASNCLLKDHRNRELIGFVLHCEKLPSVRLGAKHARIEVDQGNRAVQAGLKFEGDCLSVGKRAAEEQG
jgi:hypothetical protein